jgi:hypothetical protein
LRGGVGSEAWRNVEFPGNLYVISIDPKIILGKTDLERSHVWDISKKTALNPRSSKSYNMRAEKVFDCNVGGRLGG